LRNDKIKLGNIGIDPFVKDSILKFKTGPIDFPCYLAPETIENKIFDQKTDVW